jgi:small subunit ribosomal protein S16
VAKTRRRRAGELPLPNNAKLSCSGVSPVSRRHVRYEGKFAVAVKLRLVRMGKKKQPTYRVVAAESRRARSGAFLEIVGTYQPRGLSIAEPDTVIKIDNDKVVRWLSQGAQPTERVAKLLKTSGALDAFEAAKAEKAAK